MVENCEHNVSYIDKKGFIYCHDHGLQRKRYVNCRKMTKKEIVSLHENKKIEKF